MPTINRLPKKKRNKTENRTERQKYYNSTLWKKLRLTKLTSNPLCEKCLEKDIITAGTQIHHIHSFMNGTTDEQKLYLFLDYTNLMTICDVCHGEIHKHDKKNNNEK